MAEAEEGATPNSYKIIGHLGKLLGKSTAANKQELRELEKDLQQLTIGDGDALVEAGTLELLLRYLTVDTHFDVVTKCLMTLSAFDSARTGLYDMAEGGMTWLGEYMLSQARTAKTEKQIDKAAVLAKILVLYSVDAPESQLAWLSDLSTMLTASLESTIARAGLQEPYTFLSVMLPSMWCSMGTSFAPVIAASIISAGALPLLLRTAKDVQRSDLKGLPKIIAEKALNLLCACNAEQPSLSLQQVDAFQMASFCIQTATKSDWVQSQELSVVLLGRLVYVQHALPPSYMDSNEVQNMLQHCMTTKSPALRCTALCLSCICSEVVFDAVCVEASAAITDLGEGSYQSIKRLASPTAGGMTILRWGVPVNRFAADVLRPSKLLARMAEAVPLHLPTQLMELLPADLKTYVAGIKAANGVKDAAPEGEEEEEDLADAPAEAQPAATGTGGAGTAAGAGTRSQAAATAAAPKAAAQQAPLAHRNSVDSGANGSRGQPGSNPLKRERGGQAVSSTGSDDEATKRLKGPPQTQRQIAAASKKDAVAGPSAGSTRPVAAAQRTMNVPAMLAARNLQEGGPTGSAGRPKAEAGTSAQAPLAAIKVAPQPQAPAPRNQSGGGGEQSVGSIENNNNAGAAEPATKAFSSNDFSQLNGFLYELTMQSNGMEDKAKQVLNNLIQGVGLVPAMLNHKHKLPASVSAEYDTTLRQWASRVRQMGSSLPEAKGPALDMLVTFSNMMLDEITCCSTDMQHQVKALGAK